MIDIQIQPRIIALLLHEIQRQIFQEFFQIRVRGIAELLECDCRQQYRMARTSVPAQLTDAFGVRRSQT